MKAHPAVRKLVANALNAAIGTPSVKTTLATAEYDALILLQKKIAARMKPVHQQWAQMVKATGFKTES
jgi:hypothetical protein